MGKRKKSHYFDVDKLLKEKPNARYYFLLSGRSKGKTFGVLRRSGKDCYKGLGMFAYIRRYAEEIKTKNIQELFSPQNIEEMTNGKYNKVVYWRGFFYFERWDYDEEKDEIRRTYKNPEPCGIALAMNTWERTKGQDIAAAYGGIKHIIFDEIITGMSYLKDEFQSYFFHHFLFFR